VETVMTMFVPFLPQIDQHSFSNSLNQLPPHLETIDVSHRIKLTKFKLLSTLVVYLEL